MRPAKFLVCACLTIACTTRQVSELEPRPEAEIKRDVLVGNLNLDILFVIDNSGSMAGEQASLTANFQRFVDVLENLDVGLPNLHIGVVTSDVGIGMNGPGTCRVTGDDGLLHNPTPGSAACPTAAYIEDVDDGAGGRLRNYTGTLADAFGCTANVGTQGCGLEHHFEAMRRALDGSQPGNAGFLRPNAYLGVVFIADEDDCSANDPTIFASGVPNFRCTQEGLTCDDGPITEEIGRQYHNCRPAADTALHAPQEYVDFLRGLKGGAALAGAIVGDPSLVDISVVTRNSQPALAYACEMTGLGEATPALRIGELTQLLGGTSATICQADLSQQVEEIAKALVQPLKECLPGNVDASDIDPIAIGLQLECSVTDILDGTETVIARCPMLDPTTPDRTSLPCWWAEVNATGCDASVSPMNLGFHVERGDEPPPGTHLVSRCASETPLGLEP